MNAAAQAKQAIGRLLESATGALGQAGLPDPAQSAAYLLRHLLATDAGGLLLRRQEQLDARQVERFRTWVARRARREPLQYITGIQEFYGLPFRVDRRVLIPRPETEGLIDAVLGLELAPASRVADLGTGSGCIAVALAFHRTDLRLQALDLSSEALAVARENAVLHGVQERIRFMHGDFRAPGASLTAELDVLVANPPYVSRAEWEALQPEVKEYEPQEALVAGETGYEAQAELLPAALSLLGENGRLVLEIGWNQAAEVEKMAAAAGFCDIELRPDLRGIPRVLLARKPPGGRRQLA